MCHKKALVQPQIQNTGTNSVLRIETTRSFRFFKIVEMAYTFFLFYRVLICTAVTLLLKKCPRAPLMRVCPVIMKFNYAFLGSLATQKSKECIVCLYF